MSKSLPEHYRRTWFEWEDADGPSLSQPFVIITAYNPEGKAPSQDPEDAAVLNERANALLKEELNNFLLEAPQAGAPDPAPPVRPVIGCSRDRAHQEPSWAAPISLEVGLEFGRKYRQDAIFYVEDDALFLVGCTPGASPEFISDWNVRQLS